jgi:predicted PurR-regulated permease PerM
MAGGRALIRISDSRPPARRSITCWQAVCPPQPAALSDNFEYSKDSDTKLGVQPLIRPGSTQEASAMPCRGGMLLAYCLDITRDGSAPPSSIERRGQLMGVATTISTADQDLEGTGTAKISADHHAPAALPHTAANDRRGLSLRTINLALLLLAVLACAYVARSLLFPIIMAVVLALLLRPSVIALQHFRIGESIGAAVVLALMVMALGGLATYLYEPATRWAELGPAEVRRLEIKLRDLSRPMQAVRNATDKVAEFANATTPAAVGKPAVALERPSFGQAFGTVQRAAGTILATMMLLYFLLASGDLFLRKLIRVIPGLRDRILAVEISRSIQTDIGRYFAATTLINIGLGIVTTLVMMALGMPSPALIGTAAAILNFLPYVGAAVTLLGVFVVAALSFDGATQVITPVLALLTLATIEGQFVQPIVLGRRLALNPVAVFIWVLLWGWLWGVPGLLVAVPMLVALRICAEKIPSLQPLAELLSRD